MFYYLNGKGTVFAVDTKTGETEKSFKIDVSENQGNVVNTTWNNEKLYVFYFYPEEEEKAGLDTYDIETGKKMDTIEVEGLEEIFEHSSVSVYGYDLVILDAYQ